MSGSSLHDLDFKLIMITSENRRMTGHMRLPPRLFMYREEKGICTVWA